MATYELSIEPGLVAEAERLVTLEGRAFPTVVVQWESTMLGQTWITTIVLDYAIPLPPLKQGQTFNEVRIAAFTGDVPTKFLYFGSELNANAPRIAPEMENMLGPAKAFQEYRISEETCTVPYLDLIATTPRVYGNGPQDYYSPSIKVERFDASPGEDLIADTFPKIVAALDVIPGHVLTDPRGGHWQGARFVGTKEIAILRQGQVVGLYRRAGRDKEVVPPDVARRDPHIDVQDAWVAIDLGTSSTVVAIGDGEKTDLVRLGASDVPVKTSRDYENPSEVAFNHLPKVIKAWRDRVILPLTEWGDILVGHAARARRNVHGKEKAQRVKASVAELALMPGRFERRQDCWVAGRNDVDNPMKLDPPAPPVIDEDGIDPNEPFDPIELFAYYIGLFVNTRARGLHLRYAIGMPTGWKEDRRQQVLAIMRRGILRSLPAGMVAYDDLDLLQVVDAGPNVLSFAAYAFKVFGIAPRGTDEIPFVSIDAGASEASILCGMYRIGSPDEQAGGFKRIVEHTPAVVLPQYGGELLLHKLAYRVYASSASSMKNNDIPFDPPPGEEAIAGAEERMSSSADAQVNVRLLKDAVRPILEAPTPQPLPDLVQLFSQDGRVRDVRVMIDRAALAEWLRAQLSAMAIAIEEAIARGFAQMMRGDPPYSSMRVMLGGRVGMHTFLQERLETVLPQGVRVHRFREPDETNLAAPTVKLATTLGILTLRYQPVGPSQVSDERSSFKWRVGRSRQGKLHPVLDGSIGYDSWQELGACTRPEVSVLYADGSAVGELPADDARVRTVVCTLGYDAVGYRVYLRAVGSARVEVSFGPPGGRPSDDAPLWTVDLATATSEAVPK